jgi:hypothetical protein
MDFYRFGDQDLARRRALGPIPELVDGVPFVIDKAESALIVALYELSASGFLPDSLNLDIVEGESIGGAMLMTPVDAAAVRSRLDPLRIWVHSELRFETLAPVGDTGWWGTREEFDGIANALVESLVAYGEFLDDVVASGDFVLMFAG